MDTEGVIVAIASPPGPSARGVVRASGAACFHAVGRVLDPGCAAAVALRAARRGVYMARLQAPAPAVPALVLVMPGPGSATGEDCAEIHLVGNVFVLERTVEAIVGGVAGGATDGAAANRGAGASNAAMHGARRAGPGEFSARAVLSGRVSLAEAERVAAAIGAATDAQLAAADALRANGAGRAAVALADEVATLLALVEAGIDFTDQEDVVAIAPAALAARIESARGAIELLLSRAAGAEAARAAPRVVLAGAPNAGKSSLFNALLGDERTVESAERGTTRDAIEEAIRLPDGSEALLVDAPGLDDAVAAIDHLMQAQALQALERADLVLWCEAADEARAPRTRAPQLRVRTKCDLAPLARTADAIETSARTGAGLGALRNEIARALGERPALGAEEAALGTAQRALLEEAQRALDEALDLARSGPHGDRHRHLQHPELIASSLRASLDRLGEVAGAIPPDEVLGRLFSRFCIGK